MQDGRRRYHDPNAGRLIVQDGRIRHRDPEHRETDQLGEQRLNAAVSCWVLLLLALLLFLALLALRVYGRRGATG